MRSIRFALAMLVVGLATTAASAQSGGLLVKVSDENGPLPTAIVEISHETGFVKTTQVPTNARGEAEFPVLRPGRGYSIVVTFPGYGAQRVSDLQVKINDLTVVPVVLAQEMVEQVKVIAEGDIVRLEDTSETTKFSDDFIQDLPVPGRAYQNILTLAPGVQDADGDGNPNVHGSRDRDFQARVGGVSNVDPLTGQQMSQVNPNSIEEMEVITAGAGAEFSRAQGGFANIVQKQGSNDLEGVFEIYWRSHLLDGEGAFDGAPSLPDVKFNDYQPSFQLSGPVIKDKLWYRVSHEFIETENPIPTGSSIEIQTVSQGIHSDMLTWQVSPRNKLSFQYQADPQEINGFGVSSLTPFSSAQYRDRTSDTLQLKWSAPVSPKILIESFMAWQDLNTIIRPTSSGIPNRCVTGAVWLENASCFDADSSEVSGSYFRSVNDHRQRFTVDGNATLYGGRFWGMGHQFKMGIRAENERYFRRLDRRPTLTRFIIEPTDDDNPAGDPDGDTGPEIIGVIFATVAVPQESDVRATGTNWGVFVQDQIRVRQNLSMTLGLRFDREEISSNGLTPFDPENEFLDYLRLVANSPSNDPTFGFSTAFTGYENLFGFLDQLATDLGFSTTPVNPLILNLSVAARNSERWPRKRRNENIAIVNNNVSPRFAISWDPWSNNKTRISATAGRYYDKVYLNIPLIELEPGTANLVFNSEPRVNGPFILGAPRASVNPTVNVSAVTRNLETPYQDEWTIGFEREIFAETSIGVNYINRRFRNQLQDIDLNHIPADYGRCRQATSGNTQTVVPVMPGDPDFNPEFGQGDGIIDDCAGMILDQGATDPDAAADQLLEPTIRLEGPDGTPDLYVQNPGWGDYYLIGNFNRIDYDGAVLSLTRRQYRSWEMQGSYTWSRARGDGEDFQQLLGDDRSLLKDEVGYQSYDQRHVVKASATTITPWGFRLGGSLTWQSGLPYSLLSQDLSFDQSPPQLANAGGNTPRVRRNYLTGRRNDQRNTSYWDFRLKFTKEMNFGRGLNMQVSAEIFNLFNDGTLLIFNPLNQTGQQINGQNVSVRRFGRSWQLGMKMAF